MLPAALVIGLSFLVALPLLVAEPIRKWQVPFVWASALIAVCGLALGDLSQGSRPRWDFKDQCWLLGLRLE